MLYVDVCDGLQVTELVLRVRGARAHAVVLELFSGNAELPAPIEESNGTLRYEDRSGRDLTGVPVVEVVVTMHDDAEAFVEATYGTSTMLLTQPPAASTLAGSVRPATARECVELGLRWCFGLERMGCFDPLDAIFRGERAAAEAWVVDEPVTFKGSVPGPSSYKATTQVWLGRMVSEENADAVGQLFWTTAADAWRAGTMRRPQVLVAAFTGIDGDAPSRPSMTVDHLHLLESS
jgi:hypothetical protein